MSHRIRREYRGGHSAELLHSGEPFFAANVRLIDQARRYVHFQAYIVDEDTAGLRIFDALIRAAERGLEFTCFLMPLVQNIFQENLSGKSNHRASSSDFSPRHSLQKVFS